MTRDKDPGLLVVGEMNSPDDAAPYQLRRRFDRIARLVGEPGFLRLSRAHVMVIGLGGVGGPAAESLVRSGLGRVSLVDFDRVCRTNTNRQVQAIEINVGRGKAETLAEHLSRINPHGRIEAIGRFYSSSNSEELLSMRPDFVVDAIDNLTAKCHLLARCRALSIPVVSSLGAAGRRDPSQIRSADLARTKLDPMGRVLRKILRQQYDFPRKGDFGIPAVYSAELPAEPHPLTYDGQLDCRCDCPKPVTKPHSLDRRRVIYGSASFVTGAFGLFCASTVVHGLLSSPSS